MRRTLLRSAALRRLRERLRRGAGPPLRALDWAALDLTLAYGGASVLHAVSPRTYNIL